jgi:hypothetical protein
MGGHHFMDDSELGNLPEEAFIPFFEPIEFNDHWLKRADSDNQRIAVYEWFKARYCDPAMETPYAGREEGYNLDNHAIGFLQHVLWHRISDVSKIYLAAFDIRLPKLREIPAAIKKRHDIIHRSGYDIDHQPVYVTRKEIGALGDTVIAFATEISLLVSASRNKDEDLDASGLPDF